MNVYLSIPIKGRDDKDIEYSISQLTKLAKVYYGEDIKVSNTYDGNDIKCDTKEAVVSYITKASENLATADVFVCISNLLGFAECKIERAVADAYGLQVLKASLVFAAPDLIKNESAEMRDDPEKEEEVTKDEQAD